jgi:bifunctional enzyme CysN/CysC
VSRGTVRPGDEVTVLPAGSRTTIEEVLATDAELRPEPLAAAVPGEAVCVRLADEVDASRGDVLVSTDRPAQVADQFEVDLVWMSEQKLIPGRSHLVKIGTRLVPATVSRIKYGLDVSTLQRLPREQLGLNDVAVAVVAFDRPVPFDPYRENRAQGGFVMIDRVTGDTVGVGMIRFALRRSDNLRPHPSRVTREDRANAAGHRPGVVWFTGYSGAGKSTIADLVEQRLHASGMRTTTLDGDNLRRGLNRDLGFSEVDRVENVRRVGEVAALMADAGLIVLVALISPFRADRERARQAAGEGEFVEVFVDTPLETARGRDVKGLYAKAARGSLPNLPGVDAPYEPPLSPDVHLDTSKLSLEEAADTVVEYLTKQ